MSYFPSLNLESKDHNILHGPFTGLGEQIFGFCRTPIESFYVTELLVILILIY